MARIIRRTTGGTFTHDISPPGFDIRYIVSAKRELTRDECFAEIAKFLRANGMPAAGSCVQITHRNGPTMIAAAIPAPRTDDVGAIAA